MSNTNGGKLPSGWASCMLEDVADLVRGVAFPKEAKGNPTDQGIVACLRTTNVQKQVEWDDLWWIPDRYVRREEQMVQRGDILISVANSYELVGKVALVYEPPFPSTLGAFIALIRAISPIDCRFLYYLLASPGIQGAIRRVASTTTNISNVNTTKVKAVAVTIAPIHEQERIADALDELLSDLDAGVTALERAQAKLKHYRASVLNSAVEGSLIQSKKQYPIKRIGDAIQSLGQGWSPKCESQPSSDWDTWAVIKTTAIQPLRYLEEHNKRLPRELKPRPRLELMEGDLLITRAGPRSRVGIACLIKQTRPRLMLCDKAYRLCCNKDMLSPAFLEVVLNAPHIVAELDKLKTGISDSGLNLTQDRFSDLMIPYPSLNEQQAIVEAVEEQLSVIDHLDADIAAKLKSAQGLRQSILRHAFSGKLVPQDPNDEPASELLKRIAAEREKNASTKAADKLSKSVSKLKKKKL